MSVLQLLVFGSIFLLLLLLNFILLFLLMLDIALVDVFFSFTSYKLSFTILLFVNNKGWKFQLLCVNNVAGEFILSHEPNSSHLNFMY